MTIHSLYNQNIAKKKNLGYNNYGEKMKKKGFTLVELMAVITILAVILLVSLPSLIGTLKNSKEKRYQEFLDNLYMFTENYIASKPTEFEELKTPGNQAVITIYDLRQAEYFHVNPTNPKTDRPVSDSDMITVTRNEDKTYSYHFSGDNLE